MHKFLFYEKLTTFFEKSHLSPARKLLPVVWRKLKILIEARQNLNNIQKFTRFFIEHLIEVIQFSSKCPEYFQFFSWYFLLQFE